MTVTCLRLNDLRGGRISVVELNGVLAASRGARCLPYMPDEAAKEFGVFRHAAHLELKACEAILKRSELFEKAFLGDLFLLETSCVLAVNVGTTFHGVLLEPVGHPHDSEWSGAILAQFEDLGIDEALDQAKDVGIGAALYLTDVPLFTG